MKPRALKRALDQIDKARAPETRPLTKRQTEILDFVKAHIKRFSFPPTRAEIAKAFGVWENGIQQHLVLIAHKGHIRLIRSSRGIILT